MNVRERLISLSEESYRDFSAALVPTIDKSLILGVRVPRLRALAKELRQSGEAQLFLQTPSHKYLEENTLYALLINDVDDFELCVSLLDGFLPHVDNWATCDILSPKVFKKNTQRLLPCIMRWTASPHAYAVRFGIGVIMAHFLGENFSPDLLSLVSDIRSGEYYVNMMIAWFFATALTKQYDAALPFIENKTLDKWTHNKAIQKSLESRCVTDEQKKYLRTLKIR